MRDTTRRTDAVIFASEGVVTTGPIELPPLGDDDILIETSASVISAGTEGWVLHNRMGWAGASPYPLVPGYQRVGIVRATGDQVIGFAPGDRVFMPRGKVAGSVQAMWGGHSAIGQDVPDDVLTIPDAVNDLDAANLVVAQVGYNAASRPRLTGGETAAVFYDGLIGQMAAQALRARGARVILCGHRPRRLDLALRYSADAVVNTREQDVRVALRDLAPAGVDVVVDTTNGPDMQLYLDVLRARDGQIVLSGSYYTAYAEGKGLVVDADALQKREIALLTNQGWTRARLQATLDLMAAQRIRVAPLITHQFSYRDAAQAWRMIEARDPDVLGVAFTWST